LEKVKEIREWLNHVMEKQNAVAVYLPPVVLSHEIQSKISDIDRLATPILNRPKPKPKVEPKPADPKPAEQPKPEEPKPTPEQPQPTPENDPAHTNGGPSSSNGPEIMEVD
jgi:heat shock 70kDa protein 4